LEVRPDGRSSAYRTVPHGRVSDGVVDARRRTIGVPLEDIEVDLR